MNNEAEAAESGGTDLVQVFLDDFGGKTPSDDGQSKKDEPAREEGQDAESEELEAEEAEGEQETDDDADGDKPSAKRKKSFQERMDEVTAARRAAEREADTLRGEVEALRKLRTEDKVEPAPQQEQESAEPDPADYELGDMDPKYFSDLIDWRAEQKFDAFRKAGEAERARAEMEAHATAMRNTYDERASAAAEKYPDFEDVVTSGAARGEWPCPETVALGIMNSEVGPDVAYHLATNKAEAARIAKLHPLDQAREFGRLEARFMNPEPEEKPQLKTTSAPPPPTSRTRGSGGQFANTESALYEKALREMI
jgi:hypothetical protein